jgi:hypothetical protein
MFFSSRLDLCFVLLSFVLCFGAASRLPVIQSVVQAQYLNTCLVLVLVFAIVCVCLSLSLSLSLVLPLCLSCLVIVLSCDGLLFCDYLVSCLCVVSCFVLSWFVLPWLVCLSCVFLSFLSSVVLSLSLVYRHCLSLLDVGLRGIGLDLGLGLGCGFYCPFLFWIGLCSYF